MIKKKIGNQIITLYKVDLQDITAYSNKEQQFEQQEKDIEKKEGHGLDNMLLFA